jgi:hypothetical protein
VKKQAEVEGALEVHVVAHLLDCVGNVGTGEGEVLESPSQAAIGSRVADGGPMSEETLA